MESDRITRERVFHDRWARTAQEHPPDVIQTNEALTSPELRFIHERLGHVRGKEIMDLGCGLGEVSVYFGLRGANVTAVDLSPEMLKATENLAQAYGVSLKTHAAAAENLQLAEVVTFDVIYVGNLFHHVNIKKTLDLILPHLKQDGRLVSWDPLAYNPAINVYRRIATEVRTVDEHPLTKRDLQEIAGRFHRTEFRFFWFFTLLVFVIMTFVQFRNPNRVRFWKVVVQESDRWAWLYRPLSALDDLVLKLIPPLRWLCWNVVVVARSPK
jgi:SAM-dependent methyltransferase